MKNWIAVLPVAALIVVGAAGCERNDYAAQERAQTGMDDDAETRAGGDINARPMTDPNADARMDTQDEVAARIQGEAKADQKILSGTLDVQDDDARTFVLEGDAQTYVAPQQADLDALDGEKVIVRLDPNGRVVSIEMGADRDS